MGAQIIHAHCIKAMGGMPPNSIDSIVTDPPYGLGFMGNKWDALPPGEEWAEECFRVLKPGGHILAFGGSRTWHRLAVAIEDGGFEIRDSIAWMYGSGFPKHRAALKPAFEPVVMARKPFKGSLTANEAKHGTGALNIDASRIGQPAGRWPANVILDEHMAEALDEQSGVSKSSPFNTKAGHAHGNGSTHGAFVSKANNEGGYSDKGGASRFFYVAKATKKERPVVDGVAHPTVKPLSLMRWLCKLVTPEGGTILDPFAGSGTTLEAAQLEGFDAIGIEAEADYLPLIEHRLRRAS